MSSIAEELNTLNLGDQRLNRRARRVLYLTRLGRTCPELPCDAVFAEEKWHAVYIVTHRQAPPETPPSLNERVRRVARFGGFLNPARVMTSRVLKRFGSA